jgi:hypothetical protein
MFLFNPLNAELNPICHLLALLGAHPILHIRRIGVKMARELTGINVQSFTTIINRKKDRSSSLDYCEIKPNLY